MLCELTSWHRQVNKVTVRKFSILSTAFDIQILVAAAVRVDRCPRKLQDLSNLKAKKNRGQCTVSGRPSNF